MKTFYISLVVFFLVGSMFEYYVTRKDHKNYYNLHDFRNSVLLMITAWMVDLVVKIIAIYGLVKLADYRLFSIGYTWWAWVICYILWDFIFYIKHYLEHNVRFMWAIHVNHHSSTYMNLSTSLRSGVFKASYRYFFWAIPILIGFPLPMFLVLYGVGKIWAFFSHSQKLGHWGIFERFTITPAHHLLHHSCNENNLNKNFGETFLIWDKLFDTYKKTEGPLHYGIGQEIDDTDFKNVVFHEFDAMKQDLKKAQSRGEKLRVIFGKPGYSPSFNNKTSLS